MRIPHRFWVLACTMLFVATTAHAGVDDVKKRVNAFLQKDVVNSVTQLPVGGLYEVALNDGKILYTDEAVAFVANGEIVLTSNKKNLTAESRERLSRLDFTTLPLRQAIKRVKGNGSRVFAVFEDANCPHCKRLEKELERLDDVTVYTFLVGVVNDDSIDKAKRIWCAPDPAGAWTAWMLEAKEPEAKACKDVIDDNQVLGATVRISGTPTLFFQNSHRLVGFVTKERIETELAIVK